MGVFAYYVDMYATVKKLEVVEHIPRALNEFVYCSIIIIIMYIFNDAYIGGIILCSLMRLHH